jgi:hypothetical protein
LIISVLIISVTATRLATSISSIKQAIAKLKIISDGFSTNAGIELTRGGSTFNIVNSGNLNIVRGGLNFLTVLATGGVNIPYGNVGVGTTTGAGGGVGLGSHMVSVDPDQFGLEAVPRFFLT